MVRLSPPEINMEPEKGHIRLKIVVGSYFCSRSIFNLDGVVVGIPGSAGLDSSWAILGYPISGCFEVPNGPSVFAVLLGTPNMCVNVCQISAVVSFGTAKKPRRAIKPDNENSTIYR